MSEVRKFRYDNHKQELIVGIDETREMKNEQGEVIGSSQTIIKQTINKEGVDGILKTLEQQHQALNVQRKNLLEQIKDKDISGVDEEAIEAEIKRLQKINDYQQVKKVNSQIEDLDFNIAKVKKDLNDIKESLK